MRESFIQVPVADIALHFPAVYHGDHSTIGLKPHRVSLTCRDHRVVLGSFLNDNSIILGISVGIAPARAMVGIILQDYSHSGASQGGTTGNVDIGGNGAAV